MNYGILSEDANVGERVRYYRRKRNVSQARLAKWIGISRGVISRLECHNIQPAAHVLISIAEVLEIPVSCVFQSGTHSALIYECIPGKTVVLADGNYINFNLVQLVADFYYEPYKYICVADGDKRQLALLGNPSESTRFLCAEDEKTACFMCEKRNGKLVRETDGKVFNSLRVIAGVVGDITGLTAHVTA